MVTYQRESISAPFVRFAEQKPFSLFREQRVALLLPAVQAARESARRASCQNNLRQHGLATQNFHDTHLYLPPLRIAGAEGWATYWVLIMPYMEQRQVFDQWNIKLKYAEQSQIVREAQIKNNFCPSRRSKGLSISEGFNVADSTPGSFPRMVSPLMTAK